MTIQDSTPEIPLKQCNREACKNPLGRLLPATPEYFTRNKRKSDGLAPECKHCTAERSAEWYQKNKERRLAKGREWVQNNRERANEISRDWRKNNLERRKAAEKRHREKYRERDNAKAREYHQQHKDELNALRKEYYYENIEKEKARHKRYRVENKERLAEKQRRERLEDPEKFRERVRRSDQKHADKRRAYRQARKAEISVRSRRWYEQNKERHKAAAMRRQQADPEGWRLKNLANTHKYLARKKRAGGEFTKEDVRQQYEMQGGRCWWCEKKVGDKYHVDHIIPLARGGSNDARNICISCVECNLKKNAQMPWEFKGRLF